MFDDFGSDSPWMFFYGARNAFILSPASNFLVAATTRPLSGDLITEIDQRIATLPEGFTHRTILVVEKGIKTHLKFGETR